VTHTSVCFSAIDESENKKAKHCNFGYIVMMTLRNCTVDLLQAYFLGWNLLLSLFLVPGRLNHYSWGVS
jgi:hypothetical protein